MCRVIHVPASSGAESARSILTESFDFDFKDAILFIAFFPDPASVPLLLPSFFGLLFFTSAGPSPPSFLPPKHRAPGLLDRIQCNRESEPPLILLCLLRRERLPPPGPPPPIDPEPLPPFPLFRYPSPREKPPTAEAEPPLPPPQSLWYLRHALRRSAACREQSLRQDSSDMDT